MLLRRISKSNLPISVEKTMKCIIIGKLLSCVANLKVDLKNKKIVLEIQPFGDRYPLLWRSFPSRENDNWINLSLGVGLNTP